MSSLPISPGARTRRACSGARSTYASASTSDAIVSALRPEVIVNTAYRQREWQSTADGAAHAALAAARLGARLVHMSSDAVFSGTEPSYDEDAVPEPVNSYGAAKAAAETAIRAVDPGAAIVRTSLIIGDGRSPQEAAVHDLAAGRDRRCAVHRRDPLSGSRRRPGFGATGTGRQRRGRDPQRRRHRRTQPVRARAA